MQPLKISIPGSFWDSQIYAGRLYLFTDEGTVRTLDWDRTISEWQIEPRLRLALECAFRRSDYLYAADFSLMLQDEDIKRIILTKFDEIGQIELSVRELDDKYLIGEQDTPFPFPHSDCLIYKSQMYAGTSEGLFRATCDKRTVKPLSTRGERRWDGPSISLAASYDEIAIAAGEYGLFEIPLRKPYRGDPPATHENPCNHCSWNFQSIYCTNSGAQYGWFADYEKVKQGNDAFRSRHFVKLVNSQDIFGQQGFTWSRQDKIYLASKDGLRFVRYLPWEKQDSRFFQTKVPIPLRRDAEILAGAVAQFGVVLEYRDALSVLLSDMSEFIIDGDPVSWRIFPKSKHYENQLHVIFDDRIDVFSFNQDYFVDQEHKTLGTTNFRFGRFGPWRQFRAMPELAAEDLMDDDPEADDIDWRDILE